ncbi:Inositol-tetrakisphosphate 1-kinase [Trema orientale]|uniref:Inositol-tetrakisphosphate 1-kinase n=1 Tax=Trema orientale TaxID=63057 RepID=A0A2P5BL51_TREOI|nr:Inositol-tetrakisphosphate 1-kinase [Trema orientale]
MSASVEAGQRRYRVGYALEAKKVKTLILPSLVEHAKQKGIDLVPVDPSKPLTEQPPFHCIIHKLYGQDWKQQLSEFSSKHPNVPIIDPPERIEPLHNRISMLDCVTRIDSATVGIPRQAVAVMQDSKEAEELGLRFPVVAKPLVADGGGTSHEMYLVLNSRGWESLRLRLKDKDKDEAGATSQLVVQEFVNHGGVVFKVYVVGRHVECVRRTSLPDISTPDAVSSSEDGLLPFSRISNAAVDKHNAQMPPRELVEEMAMALRAELGLRLFNFDVIRETTSTGSHDDNNSKYVVIDINYFPGYAKMPNYEHVLTHFLLDVIANF